MKKQLIQAIQQNPSLVKIKGDRQQITLAYEEVEVQFPVQEHIYTRCICSTNQVCILNSAGLGEESVRELIPFLTAAIQQRSYSSYDVQFK